jgi:hypothetical protein
VAVASSRQIQGRTNRDDTPPAPSKLGELRSIIARMQQRIEQLEAASAGASDSQARIDLLVEILDEAIEIISLPDGVVNRRRLRQRIEEARKVLG